MTTLNTFQRFRLNFQLNRLAKKRAFAVSQNLPTAAFDRMMKPKEDLLRGPDLVIIEELDGTGAEASAGVVGSEPASKV